MSQIRTARGSDIQSFPAASFVIDGSVPETQCQEAQIDEVAGSITTGLDTITDPGAFTAINLAGKKVTVTAPVGEAGTFNVLSNTDDVLTTDNTFGATDPATAYTVHDDAQVYLRRNEDSFIRYIEANSKAFAKVNGQLYTDTADPPMNAACSDTWNPS